MGYALKMGCLFAELTPPGPPPYHFGGGGAKNDVRWITDGGVLSVERCQQREENKR